MFEATLYGLGIILGAGIYTLIGVGAGIAGNALWLSFFIGAVLAAFTALSYAELSSMYPKDAAEYVYTEHAFGKELLPFIVQWLMLFTVIVAAAAVSLGFAGYWSFLFGGNMLVIAFILIALMSLINYFGIKESARYNDISTIIEASGLVAIILMGIYYITKNQIFSSINFLEAPSGVYSIFTATTIVYFAFIGFENLANISEEAKNPQKVIPRAMLISLAVSAIIYVLVSIAAIGIMGSDALAKSNAPLADSAEKVIPKSSIALALIALFATSNTVLISLVVGSRLLYGLSENKLLPKMFLRISKRGTPFISIIFVGAVAGLSLMIGNIKKLAHLVDLGIFIVYIFVNASLIILRYKAPEAKRSFKAPFNIGKFPVLAFLGILLNLLMLYFFEFKTFMYGIVLSLVGMFFYYIFAPTSSFNKIYK